MTPYELTTGGTQFATVTTNANGEGTFTVYGSDLTATPIVYAPESTPAGTNASAVERTKYNELDLQAQAPAVKFSKIDRLAITVKAEGSADSAEYDSIPTTYDRVSTGGRTYTVTVTDKEGKIAPEGTTAYVGFKKDNVSGDVYFSTGTNNFTKVTADSVFPVRVGKDGKATFRVAGKGATTFAKPTVFLNTAGDTTPVKLDSGDVQQDGEVTYFKSPVVANATLTVKDQYGRTVTSLNAGQEAYFTYQSVDQNGFAYRPVAAGNGSTTQLVWVPVYGKDAAGNNILIGYKQELVEVPGTGNSVQQYNLTFDVTSLFGNATVKDAGGSVLNPSQNLGNTKTYQVKSDAEGKAVVRVTSAATDTVSVNVTGASNFLPTQTASVSFTNATSVPTLYTGVVESFDSVKQTLKFAGKDSISYVGTNVAYRNVNNQPIATADGFAAELARATGTVEVTYEVKDGVTTFYITKIGTTGVAPSDTAAAAPTLAFTAINGTVGKPITNPGPTVTGLPAGATLTYTASFPEGSGLTIDSKTGVISGTPTAPVAATTVTVTGTYNDAAGVARNATGPVTITVAAAPSNDATITGITVADVPAVKGAGNSYTVEVPNGTTVTAASFKVATTDAKAKAVATESTATPGTWEVVVTAEDGTTATYTVVVTTP